MRDPNAISLKQCGFMQGDSITYQLTHLYHIFSAEAIDQWKSIRVVFCGISKTFDKVWNTRLLAKLSRVGVTSGFLRWLENYLCN